MSQVILIDPDELYNLIKKAVADGLSPKSPYHSPVSVTPKLMTRQEAADYMGVKPNTITRWHKQGKITAAIIGGQYRFFESDLLKFLNKTKI